ncbi:ELM1/GtrOC1 family putative glycosyltransferase [Hansschlegelia zhihuaiae]|nr:ELM1/GtrOC1 family putative glycosyltransferase [Hansschlegelia zhihuaiae]
MTFAPNPAITELSREHVGAETDAPPARQPVAWALLARRPGDNAQIRALAEASGLDWVAKPLRFRKGLETLPNLRSGGSLLSLGAETQAALRPPFPDVVIAAGKRAAPAALWIKAASRGRTRLVHLGRTWAPSEWFDAVVTTPQYRLPARPNVVENRLPLTAAPHARGLRPDLAALPRPRITVIVGGDAAPLTLDVAAARRLAAAALARAEAAGGSLLVVTSPRTSRRAGDALETALAGAEAPVRLSIFGDGPNDYAAFLAAADEIVVTDDSVSMATEAALTGAPVTLFQLPRRFDPAGLAAGALERACGRLGAGAIFGRLVERGFISANRDIGAFMRGLEAGGLLAGGPAARTLAAAELASAAAIVRALAGAQPADFSHSATSAALRSGGNTG